MPRVRNRKSQLRILAFLRKVSFTDLDWLERIGPDYTWILRHLYSAVPCTVASLLEICSMSAYEINTKRDQALYLLGYKGKFSAKCKSIADYRREEFEVRRRLTYLRDQCECAPGDKEVIALALEHGSCATELARKCSWRYGALEHALIRLAGLKELQVIRPGEKFRRAAFCELLATGKNPKAEIERKVLEELDDETGIVDLALRWEVPQSTISALVAEVRRELAEHASTRREYARLDRERKKFKVSGSNQIKWLNARLLPLYNKFRKAAPRLSAREREYLSRRSKGTSIATAATQVLQTLHWQGTVIDRAFLQQIPTPRMEFPSELPLPPFTKEQREFMAQVKYARV